MFDRPKEPWEASDGAVYLLRELASLAPKEIGNLLPHLASLAALDGFSGFRHLQETIWHQLSTLASSLGKRVSLPFIFLKVNPNLLVEQCHLLLTSMSVSVCVDAVLMKHER